MEFVKINPKLEKISQSSEKLVLKFNIPLVCEVAKVFDLKDAVAEYLGMKSYTLRLMDIEEGCVVVTVLLPTAVANYVFANGLTPKQEADIRALSVLWLKCGSYQLEEIRQSKSYCVP